MTPERLAGLLKVAEERTGHSGGFGPARMDPSRGEDPVAKHTKDISGAKSTATPVQVRFVREMSGLGQKSVKLGTEGSDKIKNMKESGPIGIGLEPKVSQRPNGEAAARPIPVKRNEVVVFNGLDQAKPTRVEIMPGDVRFMENIGSVVRYSGPIGRAKNGSRFYY